MSTAVASVEPRRSLITEMAANYGVEPVQFFKTVKETIFSNKGSESEMIAFLVVANRYKLDPFTKEIFAFPKKDGGIQPIVSVDGWLSIVSNHPQMDGMEFVDHLDDKGGLTAVTCRIYRKDRSHPTECTEYMSECKRNTPTWSQWPRRMLRHKATIQCARIAFSISGIVEPDEFERAEGVSVTAGSRVTRAPLQLPGRAPSVAQDAPAAEPTPVDEAYQDSPGEATDGVDEPASGGPMIVDGIDRQAIRSKYEMAMTEPDARRIYDDLLGPEGPNISQDDADWLTQTYQKTLDRIRTAGKPKGKGKPAQQEHML